MKSFSNHRAKRNTPFVAMLVWAFALASGMANACLLETPGKHAHIGASQESCLKACGDGSNAQIKLQAGVDLTDPGLAPFVGFA